MNFLFPILSSSQVFVNTWISGFYFTSLILPWWLRCKPLPTLWRTWVPALGREDLLEKAMVTHPSILAWKIPWTEEPGRLQSMGLQRVGHDRATSLSFLKEPSRASSVPRDATRCQCRSWLVPSPGCC